jgi:hypothetical protein
MLLDDRGDTSDAAKPGSSRSQEMGGEEGEECKDVRSEADVGCIQEVCGSGYHLAVKISDIRY